MAQEAPVAPAQPPCHSKTGGAASTLGLPLCNSALVAVGAQQFNTTPCKATTKKANASGVEERLCNFILIHNGGCSLTLENCAFLKVFRVHFFEILCISEEVTNGFGATAFLRVSQPLIALGLKP